MSLSRGEIAVILPRQSNRRTRSRLSLFSLQTTGSNLLWPRRDDLRGTGRARASRRRTHLRVIAQRLVEHASSPMADAKRAVGGCFSDAVAHLLGQCQLAAEDVDGLAHAIRRLRLAVIRPGGQHVADVAQSAVDGLVVFERLRDSCEKRNFCPEIMVLKFNLKNKSDYNHKDKSR